MSHTGFTSVTPAKLKRLDTLTREVRLLRRQFDEAMKLVAMNALLAGTNRRLLGEIDAYRRNVATLQGQIATLNGHGRVAA